MDVTLGKSSSYFNAATSDVTASIWRQEQNDFSNFCVNNKS